MSTERLTKEQRLILRQYVEAHSTVERLGRYLKDVILPEFEIGQLVVLVGQSGSQAHEHRGVLRIYRRHLTESGMWFYQMRADDGNYAANQYEDSIIAAPEEAACQK